MTLQLEAGWRTSVVGGMEIEIDEGGGAVTVAIDAGSYCHTDLSSVLGTGEYSDLASELESQLNASGSLSYTYTVSYSATNMRYTISAGSAFAITWSSAAAARLRLAMGFSGSSSSTTSHSGTIRPYYVIRTLVGARSAFTDEYEADKITEGGEAEDGTPYSVSRTTAPIYSDFRVPFEAHEATHAYKATTSVPWTWQHFFEHVRASEPFLVDDGNEETVHVLRAGADSFTPSREVPDWDGAWNIDLATHHRGRL